MKQRTYIAIDLKSFYASVECRERGLDPLDTNLVVADESRTDKTICLAITPTLKRCTRPCSLSRYDGIRWFGFVSLETSLTENVSRAKSMVSHSSSNMMVGVPPPM